jgi:DNA-binding NarL/FixJ family response regulator
MVGQRRARVLAVDDHPDFLALVRDMLRATTGLELVGEADSGERTEELCQDLRPDIVLIDVHMRLVGGIEAAKRIKASQSSTLVVLMSTTPPDELPLDARDVADAVVWKSELGPSILDEIWMERRE